MLEIAVFREAIATQVFLESLCALEPYYSI